MVDLGPLAPWSGPPSMAVPALERWHAAWERDHPELLGSGGPSFYKPGIEPLLGGLTMAEASANCLAATERLKESFPTKGGYSAGNTPACELPPIPAHLMEQEDAAELWAYRRLTGNPDAKPPVCDCGLRIMGCPACYAPYCPSCEQRHVFDCGRRWEQQGGRYNPGGMIAAPLPPPHVDPLLIGDLYGCERKTR